MFGIGVVMLTAAAAAAVPVGLVAVVAAASTVRSGRTVGAARLGRLTARRVLERECSARRLAWPKRRNRLGLLRGT